MFFYKQSKNDALGFPFLAMVDWQMRQPHYDIKKKKVSLPIETVPTLSSSPTYLYNHWCGFTRMCGYPCAKKISCQTACIVCQSSDKFYSENK